MRHVGHLALVAQQRPSHATHRVGADPSSLQMLPAVKKQHPYFQKWLFFEFSTTLTDFCLFCRFNRTNVTTRPGRSRAISSTWREPNCPPCQCHVWHFCAETSTVSSRKQQPTNSTRSKALIDLVTRRDNLASHSKILFKIGCVFFIYLPLNRNTGDH